MHIHITPDTPIDLQLHTTYSDGRWSAEELFDYLVREGFGLVAITDHDRVDTVASILQLGTQKHMPVLSAVEISAEWHGSMGDVLCFGFDPHDQNLRAIADQVLQKAASNASQVYEELFRRGYRFPRPQDLRVAGDCATLLMRHGYVKDWSRALELIREAGYREMKADMAQTVDAVHHSGGVAILAHPGRGKLEPEEFTYYTPHLLDQVRAEIPLDGIEVYYPKHSLDLVETYLAYTQEHDLLISAGSDSHGPPGHLPIKYPAQLCRRLLERMGIQIQ